MTDKGWAAVLSPVTRGLDPRVHPSSREAFAKEMDRRGKPGDDEQARARGADRVRGTAIDLLLLNAQPPSSRRRSSFSRTPEIWRARMARRRCVSVIAASA